MRVLIVDDDRILADALRKALHRVAIAADVVHTGEDATELLTINDYDVVVLDRGLPGMHGDDVCRWITGNAPSVRVLMLTVAEQISDKVGGFAVGADDYLTKPFDLRELIARMRALMRRPAHSIPPIIEAAGITLDPFRREVHRDGRRLHLTGKQLAVLEVLMVAGGGVVSAETLLEKVWDENADPFTNTVRVTVSTLRRRLGEPTPIRTVPGSGYRFDG